MKRILVLASVAGLTLGCNKTEEIPGNALSNTKSVSFETYLGAPTKGLSATSFKMGDQFYTYGVKTGNDYFDIASPQFSEYVFTDATKSATVSHLGTNPNTGEVIWNYGNPVAWDSKKATFFAFSPVPQGTETFGITNPTIADNTIPTIDFEVKGGYDPAVVDLNDPAVAAARELIKGQTDLLWAYSADNTQLTGAIAFDFRHALSLIRFSVRGYHSVGWLRVNSVTLKNVMTKATLNLTHDFAKSGDIDYLGGWSAATEPKNFAVNLQTDAVSAIPPIAQGATTPTTWSITDDDESLTMLPQTLKNIELEVKYSYSPNGKEWTDYEDGTNMKYILSTLSSHWSPNKRYNYILSIYPGKAVAFTTDIDAWEPTSGSADLEHRAFDIIYKEGMLTRKSDSGPEKFILNEGDQITTTYALGTNWLKAVDKSGAEHTLEATVLAITSANEGEWTIKAGWNDGAPVRNAVIVVQKAPYDKTLPDGTVVKVKSGVAKYTVAQEGFAPSRGTIVYGSGLGAIITSLQGYTMTSYTNEKGTTPYATADAAYTGEKGFRRLRLSAAQSASTMQLDAAIEYCSSYAENGAPSGKWRLPKISEMKLIANNYSTINGIGGGFVTIRNSNYWSTTLSTTADSYYRIGGTSGVVALDNQTALCYARCVYEEK